MSGMLSGVSIQPWLMLKVVYVCQQGYTYFGNTYGTGDTHSLSVRLNLLHPSYYAGKQGDTFRETNLLMQKTKLLHCMQ